MVKLKKNIPEWMKVKLAEYKVLIETKSDNHSTMYFETNQEACKFVDWAKTQTEISAISKPIKLEEEIAFVNC